MNYDAAATDDDGSCQYCDLSISQFVFVQNSSPSACDGWSFVIANSSNPPISYSWSNGSTQNNTTNLCSGNYTLTVTDATGTITTLVVPVGDFKF